MNNLLKFYNLTAQERKLLLESVIFLGFFRLIIVIIPFKRIAPYLGHHMQESYTDNNDEEMPVIKNISWAVNVMSRHTFWDSKCLVQAITAKYMLRRRNIKSTLYLGVARDENQSMFAHAWLRSGQTIVTGAKAKMNFVILSSFADI
ncbi:lasso peptide biosynthesis B2 protein [Syntrophomonas wolfei]|jgi:hypothetical protein|uniref:lasso peptide biosynthesis B2 protein n=1 Tax=Syntrophomonas wolfei TaxID=863 RepID=UPI0023EFC34B|nr:lasso peptide biosynthesis B2 protein [Syntrophomonas wolfei]